MATRTACAVSLASAGRITRMLGMARIAASCSTGWCVGPSWPSPIESWVQEKMTFVLERADSRTEPLM